MFTKKFLIINSFVLSLSLMGLTAHAADISASVVVSPVGDFTAEFKDIDVTVIATGETYKANSFVIPWASLKTGMGMRDKHALDYFNAKDHPNIEVLSVLAKGGNGAAKIKMNGVEKIVKGTYKIEDGQLVADLPIVLSQFNVKNINFKGAGVQDEVKVKITAPIKK